MNTPPPPGSNDDDPRPEVPRRRNSLTNLDPRQTKRQRRMAIVTTPDEDDGPDSPKHMFAQMSLDGPGIQAEEKIHRLSDLLRKHAICGSWAPDLCRKIYAEFKLEEYKRGASVFNGPNSDDTFYVVEKGFCGIEGAGPAAGPGCTFGDLCLVQVGPKKQSIITALCDLTIWSVDGGMVRLMIMQHQTARFQTVKNFFLQHAHVLGLATSEDMRLVTETSSAITLGLGQGLQVTDSIYIVRDGDVEETKWFSPQTLIPSVRRKKALDVIGVEAMRGVENLKVVCLSESCTLLSVRFSTIEQIPAFKQALLASFYRAG